MQSIGFHRDSSTMCCHQWPSMPSDKAIDVLDGNVHAWIDLLLCSAGALPVPTQVPLPVLCTCACAWLLTLTSEICQHLQHWQLWQSWSPIWLYFVRVFQLLSNDVCNQLIVCLRRCTWPPQWPMHCRSGGCELWTHWLSDCPQP